MKISYDYTGGSYGVTFGGGFHGRTLGALSVNRSKSKYRRGFPRSRQDSRRPFCADSGCTAATCDCGFFADDTSTLRRMLDPERGTIDPDDAAYVILEPIQGAGGYRFPSDAFMDEIADVCNELDVPIVVDEVQSGLGRTGEMWAADHYAIEPDVIASAKALPRRRDHLPRGGVPRGEGPALLDLGRGRHSRRRAGRAHHRRHPGFTI